MLESKGQRNRTQNIYLAKPVNRDRVTCCPASVKIAFLEQHQALGNQAIQRLAQSCPVFPSRCPFGGACHTCPARVQAKLTVNKPGYKHEQEADRVAKQVMRMPEPRLQRQVEPEDEEEETIQTKPLAAQITPLVQRQEEPEEEPIQAKLADCVQVQRQEEEPEEEEEELIQTKQARRKAPQAGPGLEAQIRSLRGGGRPLPASARSFFEPRFGHDLSQVRVHTGAQAAESARALNARAYTVGRDMVFGAGQFAPEATEGKRLLAHELAHTVQQRRGNGLVYRRSRGRRRRRRITDVSRPKLSLYQKHWRHANFFRGLANRKARRIRAIAFDLQPTCPTRVKYGSIPYDTGADIVTAIAKAARCTGHPVTQVHIFGHSGFAGVYSTALFESYGLYPVPIPATTRRVRARLRAGGARSVKDIPKGALARNVVFVMHGCSTAYGDDSFAEALLKELLGSKPRAKVYGHNVGGVAGGYLHWKEFSRRHPEGRYRRTIPYHRLRRRRGP